MVASGGTELGFHALTGDTGSWEEATKQTPLSLVKPPTAVLGQLLVWQNACGTQGRGHDQGCPRCTCRNDTWTIFCSVALMTRDNCRPSSGILLIYVASLYTSLHFTLSIEWHSPDA